ncbi:MAG: OmpA family protein, partial [Candidatus Cloacimonadaceae bacterium]|nr:OmpA family protein [Candidatus Cloacimonadaceae bacterium]
NPDYALLMGRVLLAMGDYKNAYSWLSKYATSYLGSDMIARPELMDKIFEASIIQGDAPLFIALGSIKGLLNSNDSEYAPVLAEGGRTMIIGSNRRSVYSGENIFISSLVDQAWTEPKEIKELCTDRNETVGSLSKDEKTMYISGLYDTRDTNSNLYKSTFVKGAWTKPEPLTVLNSKFNDIQPFVYDDKVMFFTSNRHGTNRNYDIYVSEYIRGAWQTPISIGKGINSPFDEQSPYLSPDGRTLYFASNGHAGFGGFDIFKSQRIGDSWIDWTVPENLGPLFNSHKDERHYVISPDGNSAYLSSNRYGGVGLEDIFQVDLGLLERARKQAAERLAAMVKKDLAVEDTTQVINDYNVIGFVVNQDNQPLAIDIIWTYGLDGVTYMQIVESAQDGSFGFIMPYDITFLAYEVNVPGYYRITDQVDISGPERELFVKIVCTADDGTTDGRYVNITGIVVDEYSNPVSTQVRWSFIYNEVMNDIIVETNDKGKFRFYVPPTDKIRYTINDERYAPREELIILPQTNVYDITIRLVSAMNEMKISGMVVDTDGEPLTANIFWTYKRGMETIEYRVLSGPDGTYKVSLPVMPMVSYRLDKVNYMPIAGSMDLPKDTREHTMNFTMTKLVEREVFNIANILFEFNKAILLPESSNVLDPLAKMMVDNPSLTIELSGHTDIIGTREINMRLSGQRAQAVADYLVSKGIDKGRITSVGYGFDKPIADNKTPEGRAQNRRVEMTVIGIEYVKDAYEGLSEAFKGKDGTTQVVRPATPSAPARATATGDLPAATEDHFKGIVISAMGNSRGNLRVNMFFDKGRVQSVKIDVLSGSVPETTIDQISDLLIGWKIPTDKRFIHTLNVQK